MVDDSENVSSSSDETEEKGLSILSLPDHDAVYIFLIHGVCLAAYTSICNSVIRYSESVSVTVMNLILGSPSLLTASHSTLMDASLVARTIVLRGMRVMRPMRPMTPMRPMRAFTNHCQKMQL